MGGGITMSESKPVAPRNLRCEYLVNPLGIDVSMPRLSWQLYSEQRGQKQTGYQIMVASSKERLDEDNGDLWDSGRISSDQSTNIEYPGKELKSGQRCWWKVRIWDRDGVASPWSEPAMWSMGLLKKEDWKGAKFVGADWDADPAQPFPWICKDVVLDDKPVYAAAHVCALGYYALYVNGRKVDDHVLSPAVSDYSKRVYYITHDVTEYLTEGKNCIALWLGRGWYVKGNPGVVHTGPLVKALIDMDFASGESLEIVTDESCKVHPSPITPLGSGIPFRDYGGERYDARLELENWNKPEFDRSSWDSAKVFDVPDVTVESQKVQPNRIRETIEPVKIEELPSGEYMVDMGVNFTGWLRIKFAGDNENGREVRLEYADLREDDSKLRSYNQTDIYIMKGEGEEEFRSRFNYHAFRWVRITGLSYKPSLDCIKGYLIHTDYPSASEFDCSNELLTRIYKAVAWTYRCLTLGGYIVDCPHRERLGYGGDAGTSFETGMFNFDVSALYTKWLGNWRDAQNDDGDLPYTAPTYIDRGGGGPMWSGMCVTLPWQLYLHYGDERILEVSYPTIKKWLEFVDTKTVDGILEPYVSYGISYPQWNFLGDWVRPHGGRADENTNKFINNCFHLYELQISEKIARLLNKNQEAAAYREKAQALRGLLHERFFNPADKTYANGEQPYLALALLLHIVPAELRAEVKENLERLILIKDKGHLNSGMHGTYFLLKYLMEEYRNDLIFEMTSKKTYPSWGYMLENGATTIWEAWDGSNSRIHDTLISIGSWFIQGIAGIRIDQDSPGFRHFLIRPAVVGDLRWTRASFDSIHGRISVDWKLEGDALRIDLMVPANTTATVYVPAKRASDVMAGDTPAEESDGVQLSGVEDDMVAYLVGSGKYAFTSKVEKNETD
jgi:alpha-L-rhamnosidase